MHIQGVGDLRFLFSRLLQTRFMDITPDLPFLNIHNPFTNEKITVYVDKHNCMFLNTKDYFVKQISHLSKGVVVVASA